MRNIRALLLSAIVAASFTACGEMTANKSANNAVANTGTTAKPAPANKEELFAMDKQANEAWIKGDAKFFEGFLSDKFVSFEQGERMDRAGMLKMLGTFKCDVKSWSLDDPEMAMIDADTAVISYKGTYDGTCTGPDGKSMKLPSPTRSASVYVRYGGKWEGAYHGETPIIDPKATAAAPVAEKKDEPKKEEAKKAEPKKDEPKKDHMADDKDAKTADSKPAATKLTADGHTAKLVELHTAGWEAFKAKDAKKFEELMSSNFSFVDPLGGWHGSKADAIKTWTVDMKCEGINEVKITDGFASALSPTVELLTLKGTADGTCNGEKNGSLYQAAVFVKEGETWKLAFMFESPAM